MKKAIVFGSIFVVLLLLALPTISATPSFEEKEELVNSLNESNVPPNFPVHLLKLRNSAQLGGPLYNLLSDIIFWIGILLGIWPYR